MQNYISPENALSKPILQHYGKGHNKFVDKKTSILESTKCFGLILKTKIKPNQIKPNESASEKWKCISGTNVTNITLYCGYT